MSMTPNLLVLGIAFILFIGLLIALIFGIRALIRYNARQKAKNTRQEELEKMKLKDL